MIQTRCVNSGQNTKWRLARAADLDAIQTIANAVHPNVSERPEVLAEKLGLFPEGCFVLVEDGGVLGYAFVHPWRLNDIPKLDDFLLSLPPNPECLLIHDMAVLPEARGKGASKSLVEQISRLAKRQSLHFLALVSVYGSHLHWARLGFELTTDDIVAPKLVSYGETAHYMVCRLG